MPMRFLFLALLLLLLAGCGGGADTSPPVPAAVKLEATSAGTDGAGNDVVTVTASVTDGAGHPVSGRVDVRVNLTQPPYGSQMLPASPAPATSIITGTSDVNGQLSVPVTIDPLMPTMITAAAGTATSNTISVYPSGDASAQTLVAVMPSPEGRYAVNCSGFTGVAAVEVDITYDPAAASGPVIEKGPFLSGVLMVTNTQTAGILRMASIKPYPQSLSGAGTLATFSFGQETATPSGTLAALQVTLLDVTGGPIPARTMLINSYAFGLIGRESIVYARR